MLAIFDIDGTICDTQSAENACYAQAILEIIGIELETLDWTAYREPTSSGIVRNLLQEDLFAEQKEEANKKRFVDLLRQARPVYPHDFSPIEGVVEFLEVLKKNEHYQVAIATGGFDIEARFKLECCGIDIDDYPHATSSDIPDRRKIIPLAATRAGFPLASSVYFGDASWDIIVSRELGIPLIGIGRKRDLFIKHDMKDHFRDFRDVDPIFDLLAIHKGASRKRL